MKEAILSSHLHEIPEMSELSQEKQTDVGQGVSVREGADYTGVQGQTENFRILGMFYILMW